jgi:hypothetical protein
MNRRQGRVLLSLYAVDVFLDAYEHRLPATASAGMRDRFRHKLAEVELHVQTQSGAPIMAERLTAAKGAKREALLRDHLAPIARIAKLESANHPALAALRMPRGAPGTGKLLAHAAGMANVAQDYADVFVAAGLRPTFIEELNDAIDDILTTVTARTEKRGARAGATRGLSTSLTACSRYKAVLDTFIQREARGDRPLLENWRSVKRVGRLPRRPRTAAVAATNALTQLSLAGPALPIRDPNRLLPMPAHAPAVDSRQPTVERIVIDD